MASPGPSGPPRDPSPALRGYVATVVGVGLVVLVASAVQLPSTPRPLEWGVFAVLALVAGSFALKMPGVPAHLSVSDTFFITSVLLFGPAPATVAVAVDSALMSWRRKQPVDRILFNTASPALALWLAAQAFFALTGSPPLVEAETPPGAIVVPLACLAGIYLVLNSGFIAVAVALQRGGSAVALWRSHFALISLSQCASASAAFVLIVVIRYVGIGALAAVLPLLGVFYLAMQSWLGRLDDAQRHVAKVDRLYLSTIEALSTAIEAKDGVTSSHIRRVQAYALGLARALDVTDEPTLKALEAAALLHDTGKLAVPEHILNKPGKLTPAEFETMKLHVDVGADILASIDFPYPVVPIVRAHHESWDGSGYPRGLRGEAIPIGARILSVVDCFDALTSDRPYRPAMTDEEALRIVQSRRGSMYDPSVVDTFVRVYRDLAPAPEAPPALHQRALEQISRAARRDPVPAPAAAPRGRVDASEELLAIVSLGRVLDGQAAATDIASLAWGQIRHVVRRSSCAVYLREAKSDAIAVRFAGGEAADTLRDVTMALGHRMSGWVAAHRQAIVNSEAALDLGPAAGAAGLRFGLAVPLESGGELAGVLTLYAADPFTDAQVRIVQMVAPHLGRMLAAARPEPAVAEPVADAALARAGRAALRVVAGRHAS